MEDTFTPKGYSSVSPYFSATDSDEFCKFIMKVFDATQIARFDHEDGTIYHAELRLGNSVIMVTEARDDFEAREIYIHVYVKDALATYHQALPEEAIGVAEPEIAEGDTDERGMFRDKWGNVWAIATHNKGRE